MLRIYPVTLEMVREVRRFLPTDGADAPARLDEGMTDCPGEKDGAPLGRRPLAGIRQGHPLVANKHLNTQSRPSPQHLSTD